MASSALSFSVLSSLSPLRPHPYSSSPDPPLPSTPLVASLKSHTRRCSLPLVSSSSKPLSFPFLPLLCHEHFFKQFRCAQGASEAPTSEEKQRILERYGLDPSDFVSDPPSYRSGRRRREAEKAGKGKRAAPPPEEPKPPRTTHKLLQVLGGKARRKKLLSPKGMDVRPMMEVVRGAAFDILQAAGGCPVCLRPGRWLDLYSGTGSVGIEAISRGCSEAHFVEMDPWVVSEVLRPNLEWTGFLDVSVIHTTRVESFLGQAEQSLGKGRSFDYVSVTPPYTAVDYSMLMEQVGKSPLVGEDCFILVEYPLKTSMSDSCGHLIKVADRRFGRTNLIIYGPTWAQKNRKSKRPLLTLD